MILLFKKVLAHFLFQLLCLAGISFVSQYKIPDLSEADWNSALFLTPVGIIRNFNDASPVMRSFYSDFSTGQVELSALQIAIISGLLIAQIVNFTQLISRLRRVLPQ